MTGILWHVAGWAIGRVGAAIITATGLYGFTAVALLMLRGTG